MPLAGEDGDAHTAASERWQDVVLLPRDARAGSVQPVAITRSGCYQTGFGPPRWAHGVWWPALRLATRLAASQNVVFRRRI